MAWHARPGAYTDPQMQRAYEWCARVLNGSEATASLIGCSPEAIVAQAALETGWGRASIGNNIFGIKADPSWKGPRLQRRTAEQRPDGSVYFIDDWFRDYPTLTDGIMDHFLFLKNNSRYKNVFDVDGTMSDHEYFAALQRDGYATDVRYAEKLDAMLESVKTFEAKMATGGDVVVQRVPRTLMVGLQGTDVADLQARLNAAAGIDPKLVADGDFGLATYAAVKQFQAAQGLQVDGIVGPSTRSKLGL